MPMRPHVAFRCLTAAVIAISAAALVLRPAAVAAPRSAPTPVPLPPPGTVLGTISGRVVRDGGAPAAGFVVTAVPGFRYDEYHTASATTDLDGRYTITLGPPTGPLFFYSGPINIHAQGYDVYVSSGGQPYVEPPPQNADPASRPDHAATGVDFVLLLGPQVIVRARDAITGNPDAGLTIQTLSASDVRQTPTGVTGPDGTLRLRVPLTHFWLKADLPNALEAAPGYGISKQITALPGQQVAWDIKTYGNGSPLDNDWHGVVLGPDGKPVNGATVKLMREGYQNARTLESDARGRFSAILPRIDSGEAAPVVYPDRPIIYARRGADAVAQVVTPDESWDGMTLRLAPGACLTGTLTGPTGRPAAHVGVTPTGSILGLSPSQDLHPEAVTDDRGRFTLSGLPPGNYQIRFHGGGYGLITYPPTMSRLSAMQPVLTLAAGQQSFVGTLTDPRADRVLAGRVVSPQGAPMPLLNVYVTGAHTDEAAITERDGTFFVYDLVDEPLSMDVEGPGIHLREGIKSGQTAVRVVAPPADIARVSSPPPVPQSPAGPWKVIPSSATIPLDGLALSIQPGIGGTYSATIIRPNDVNAEKHSPPYPAVPGVPPMGTIWHGSLAAADGMTLAVRHDRGRLTDATGRVLWSGVVVDPPDYIVTSTQSRSGVCTVTVRSGGGRTLWSGRAATGTFWDMTDDDDINNDGVDDNDIRVIGLDHTVVWERDLGDARVALRDIGPGNGWQPDPAPADGTVTLRVEPTTGTLRSAEGAVLWTGQTPSLTATVTGFPPEPERAGHNLTPQALACLTRRLFLWPTTRLNLLGVENPPVGSALSFTDTAGRPLTGDTERFASH